MALLDSSYIFVIFGASLLGSAPSAETDLPRSIPYDQNMSVNSRQPGQLPRTNVQRGDTQRVKSVACNCQQSLRFCSNSSRSARSGPPLTIYTSLVAHSVFAPAIIISRQDSSCIKSYRVLVISVSTSLPFCQLYCPAHSRG